MKLSPERPAVRLTLMYPVNMVAPCRCAAGDQSTRFGHLEQTKQRDDHRQRQEHVVEREQAVDRRLDLAIADAGGVADEVDSVGALRERVARETERDRQVREQPRVV